MGVQMIVKRFQVRVVVGNPLVDLACPGFQLFGVGSLRLCREGVALKKSAHGQGHKKDELVSKSTEISVQHGLFPLEHLRACSPHRPEEVPRIYQNSNNEKHLRYRRRDGENPRSLRLLAVSLFP